jgi:hypothetical protein
MKKVIFAALIPLLIALQPDTNAQTPSSSAVIPSLQWSIRTGGDDLRSGSVAYAEIRLRDGKTLPRVNLNGGRGWANNSTNSGSLPLPAGTRLGDLESLTLIHDGAPRRVPDGYDNWNVDAVRISTPQVCSSGVSLANPSNRPWVRFTGGKTFEDVPLSIPSASREAVSSSLQWSIRTGGDDLRSGSVVYAEIRLRDGRTLPRVNLNGGRGWGNNSTNSGSLPLPAGTRLGDLASLTLIHDGAARRVPDGYDNWNVDAVRISTPQVCSGGVSLANPSDRPWVRFTGGKTFETIRFRMP